MTSTGVVRNRRNRQEVVRFPTSLLSLLLSPLSPVTRGHRLIFAGLLVCNVIREWIRRKAIAKKLTGTQILDGLLYLLELVSVDIRQNSKIHSFDTFFTTPTLIAVCTMSVNEQGTSRRRKTSTRSSWVFDEVWDAWEELARGDKTHRQVDWCSVLAALRRCESDTIAHYSDPERDHLFLLHLVAGLNPPLNVVEVLITANPKALSNQASKGGLTPLMIACGRNASRRVIRLLLRDKKALAVCDASGQAAVHWACRENVSHEVMKQLLYSDPSQAWRQVQKLLSVRGGVPFLAQHHVGCVESPLEILYLHPGTGSTTGFATAASRSNTAWDRNQWQKLSYLLWARHYGSINTRSQHSFSVLHAALALKCPVDVIDTALRLHRDVAGARDVHSNLPLHYAVQSWTVTDAHICQLLTAFPPAAATRDGNNRFPLHEALKSGKGWHQGVSRIYESFPAAASHQDDDTFLPPVLLAAAYSDLDSTFCLLRECPQVVASAG